MMRLKCGRSKGSTEGAPGTVRSHFLFLAVCFVILALSAATLGQELAATLTGTVTDPSGAVVAGATVSVHSEDTGADLRTVTTSAPATSISRISPRAVTR